MSVNRRDFLRTGLLAAGAMAASKVPGAANNEAAPATAEAKVAGTTCPACTTQALTPGGKVIHVADGKVVSRPLPVLSNAEARRGIPGRKWVMVIDLAKCDGCGHCTAACAKMHFIPPDRQWIKVLRMREDAETAPYFFPQPCYHCDNPPCTKVCPVDATFKRQDGIVLIDNERCIGCRFCMAACPYGARSFNWGHPQDPPEAAAEAYSPEHGFPRRLGTVEKCDFCPDMAEKGMLPGCAAGCPMGAIYYGDQNEDAVSNSQGETHRLTKLLRDRAGYRHLEELGTQPRVYYLPPKNRAFPAPDEGKSTPSGDGGRT